MDNSRLKQMADAAQSGYWPPHLLARDEDRVVVLGDALSQALSDLENQDDLIERADAAEEEADELRCDIAVLKEEIESLKSQ